jgi:hypothetical protein
VIKVGTSSLIHPTNHTLWLSQMARIAEAVRTLKDQGHRVVLVSSGAVGAGCQVGRREGDAGRRRLTLGLVLFPVRVGGNPRGTPFFVSSKLDVNHTGHRKSRITDIDPRRIADPGPWATHTLTYLHHEDHTPLTQLAHTTLDSYIMNLTLTLTLTLTLHPLEPNRTEPNRTEPNPTPHLWTTTIMIVLLTVSLFLLLLLLLLLPPLLLILLLLLLSQRLGIKDRPSQIEAKQALASVGQVHLMRFWDDILSANGITSSQVLLTASNLSTRSQYLNARATFVQLLNLGVVPIVNENDTVSVEQLRYGDNDTLSAQVAALVHANYLFLMTDVDGLYTANPNTDPEAKRIDHGTVHIYIYIYTLLCRCHRRIPYALFM